MPHVVDTIGELQLGNQAHSYEVSGSVPEALSALLSPHMDTL